MADVDVLRMTSIFCQQISRKEVDVVTTGMTRLHFDPEEIFDGYVRCITLRTARCIEGTYRLSKLSKKHVSCLAIGNEIKMFRLLTYNSICHGIDIIAYDIAA